MALSNREISFYVYVTGFSIYVVALLLFLWFPFRLMLLQGMTEDVLIPSVLMLPIANVVSILVFFVAHRIYPYFNARKTIVMMILPYVLGIFGGLLWT